MTGATGRTAGFTIMELLIVLAIIGILIGMGAGVFLGLMEAGRFESAQQEVVNLVRKARNAARGEERSAVLVEDGGTRLRASLQKVIALWHCEDLEGGTTTGADRKDAKVTGGTLIDDGFLGSAISLRNGYLDGGRYPDYEVTDGLGVEILVRPRVRSKMTLVQKGRSWRVWLEPAELGLVARAFVRVGRSEASESVLELRAEDAPIPLGRWSRVAFSFDRAVATLSVNEIERDRLPREEDVEEDDPGLAEPGAGAGGAARAAPDEEPETTRPIVPDPEENLTIGSLDGPIDGDVDQIRVTGVLSGDVVPMPDGVTVRSDVRAIRFRDNGLDTEHHRAPVVLRLDFGERGSRRITIGLNGQAMRR